MIASHHRPRRQDHAVIKSFTHHVTQRSFNFHIPRPLIHLILIVIKQMGNTIFRAHLFNYFDAGDKVIHFTEQKRNTFFRQRDS